MQTTIKQKTLSLALLAGFAGLSLSLTGCEKMANSAKNIQSDWVGLERNVEFYSCMTGKLVKKYQGDVRLNPEDFHGTSLLIDGKKVHTNLCFVISEIGVKEERISNSNP